MAVLLLVLTLTFVHYSRAVREQAEVAAFKATVGALRTALVVDHLRQQVVSAREPGVRPDLNPFTRLSQPPSNYAGSVLRVHSRTVAPGTWIYAPDCQCVGYRPQDDASLSGLADDPLIWLALSRISGVLQLVPREKYLWYNELLD